MPDEDAPDQAILELAGMVIDKLKEQDFASGSYSHYAYYLEDPGGQLALATVFTQLNITQVVDQPRFNPTTMRSVG